MRNIGIALAVETVCLCALYLFVWSWKGDAPVFSGAQYSPGVGHWVVPDQYALLADALLHGRLTLDLPVDPSLLALPNPYDYDARLALGAGQDAQMFWDYAYYRGSYYSYFGVVPALLVYAPYELVTGQFLSTPVAVAVMGVGAVAAEGLLSYQLIRCFFGGSANVPSALLVGLVMFGGCNVVYLESVPRFYSVPLLASLFFTFAGLSLWLAARRRLIGMGSGARGAVRLPARRATAALLFAGSLCMAANLGCRPQFTLACFLALPLFWPAIAKERVLFSRDGIGLTVAALLPFALVFVPLLAYNAARFGSPFDFGSSYNLTGFDMTTYEQTPHRTLELLFCFLLQPLSFSSDFPFVHALSNEQLLALLSHPGQAAAMMLPSLAVMLLTCLSVGHALRSLWKRNRIAALVAIAAIAVALCWLAFMLVQIVRADDLRALMGSSPYEPMFGGYVLLVPSSLLVLALPWLRDDLKGRGLWAACLLMVLFAAVVLVADTRVAGITQRYFTDFGWYLMLVSCIVLLALQARRPVPGQAGRHAAQRGSRGRGVWAWRAAAGFVAASLVFSAVVGGFSLLSGERYDTLQESNPALYEQIERVFSS